MSEENISRIDNGAVEENMSRMDNAIFEDGIASEALEVESSVDYKAERTYFGKLGLVYFAGSLLYLGGQLLMIQLSNMFWPDLVENYYMLLYFLPLYAVVIPIIYFIISRIPAAPVPKKEFSPWKLIPVFLICFATMYIANVVGSVLNWGLATIAGKQATNALQNMVMGSDWAQLLLITAILAPIVEELLFRKLLVDRLARYGEGVAIVVSGLVFAFYHGNIIQFVYAFFLGCIFAYVYLKSGRVIYTIFLHMLINFCGSVVPMIIIEVSNYMEFGQALRENPDKMMELIAQYQTALVILGAYYFCLVVLIIAGIIVFLVNKKKIVINAGEVTLEKGKRFKTVVLNFGTPLFLLVWLIMMILNI